MRVEIPFKVEYETRGAVPIGEVIDSLIACRNLLEEGGEALSLFLPGIVVENVKIGVRSVSQESPLRELFLVALFLAFQKDLEREVPEFVETMTGVEIPDNLDTLVTVTVLILLYYGIAYVKDVASGRVADSRIQRQLDSMIAEMAERTGQSPDEIRKRMDDRYKPKSRINNLAATCFKFFRPSKNQANAPIQVSDRVIPSEVIAEVPPDYVYESEAEANKSKPFTDIVLDIHAQDRDRESTGWAAIPRGLSDKRVRMKLMDGVTPDQLWGRDTVKGDGVVIYERKGVDFVPIEIHVTRIRD